MKYPEKCKNIVDVTKAPYFADNSGKTDVTDILRQAIDDCLADYIESIEATKQKLLALKKEQGGNVYVGAEAGRIVNDEILITFPERIPQTKILFFPVGTYLVSDTVSYTFKNLHTRQQINYYCELCRDIHILGESRENTVIKLADNTKGFKAGQEKPVLCFNPAGREDAETTNCAQMNTLEDITIDCGENNGGAVGVLYAASNVGRIENVTVKAKSGVCGIKFDYGCECCIRDLTVEGFDYGIKTGHTSPVVVDNSDLSGNRVACIYAKDANLNLKNITWGKIPAFDFVKGAFGRYYVENDVSYIGDATGNFLFKSQDNLFEQNRPWPRPKRCENFENWAFVDDFGAVADGETDSATAIQRAMDSGKEVICFGEGAYVIGRTVRIPKTVKVVDFMYAQIKPGYSLLIGEMEGMFDICEESKDVLVAEHLSSVAPGFFRLCKHSACRPTMLKDMFISAALYFNTANGNQVYFDNCFTHTEHYAQDCMRRDGYIPVFCRMIPVELHNQTAYAKNLNIERGEIELLNDNSVLLIDGYKTEGPGVLVKAINGGRTQLNLVNAAWWGNKATNNYMLDIDRSVLLLIGGHIFCYSENHDLRVALHVTKDNDERKTDLYDCSIPLRGRDALGRDLGRLIECILV